MSDTITQQELADALGYSQGRVSEATGSEDLLYPDFLDAPFDPNDYAVEKGDHFQGYDSEDLPEPVRKRLGASSGEPAEENPSSSNDAPRTEPKALPTVSVPDLTPSVQQSPAQVFLPERAVEVGSRPAYAAAGHPVKTAGNQPITARLLSGNEVHLQREQTNASVVPEGTDVSQSVAYGSVAHVTETAVRQDPALAWAAMGLAGGGVGAFAGYQADGTAEGMAAGAAAGTTVTLVSGLIGVAVARSGRR
ncbi:hypothetical protein GGP49_003271 [Salinibacter ruber]|uniref:hypothetical protein n=1 Tax=Salinibacter ruber TaxID=146919 RepID=UPI002168DEEE|nr:hypothetical protein [Salinibacter ruber]MCS4116319.1 hypothetical protein [Salinibacter ruber]